MVAVSAAITTVLQTSRGLRTGKRATLPTLNWLLHCWHVKTVQPPQVESLCRFFSCSDMRLVDSDCFWMQSNVAVTPAPAGATPGRSPVVPLTPHSQTNSTSPANALAPSSSTGSAAASASSGTAASGKRCSTDHSLAKHSSNI